MIKKLVIDRRTWLRGSRTNNRLLWGGNMCCLGFLSIQCGISPNDIDGLSTPASLYYRDSEKLPKELFDGDTNSELSNKLMHINDGKFDYTEISENARESLLELEFNKIGIEVEFQN